MPRATSIDETLKRSSAVGRLSISLPIGSLLMAMHFILSNQHACRMLFSMMWNIIHHCLHPAICRPMRCLHLLIIASFSIPSTYAHRGRIGIAVILIDSQSTSGCRAQPPIANFIAKCRPGTIISSRVNADTESQSAYTTAISVVWPCKLWVRHRRRVVKCSLKYGFIGETTHWWRLEIR